MIKLAFVSVWFIFMDVMASHINVSCKVIKLAFVSVWFIFMDVMASHLQGPFSRHKSAKVVNCDDTFGDVTRK